MPKTINDTHIRLIPKITGLKKVADYRSTMLCNVYYNLKAIIKKNAAYSRGYYLSKPVRFSP